MTLQCTAGGFIINQQAICYRNRMLVRTSFLASWIPAVGRTCHWIWTLISTTAHGLTAGKPGNHYRTSSSPKVKHICNINRCTAPGCQKALNHNHFYLILFCVISAGRAWTINCKSPSRPGGDYFCKYAT